MVMKKGCVCITSCVLAILLALSALPAKALTSDEIREQIRDLEEQGDALSEEIQALEDKLSDNLTQMKEMVRQKDLIDRQIQLLSQQIDNTNERIRAYALLVADQQDALDVAQGKLEALNEKYKERIRAMEEEGAVSYWSVLFRANSFRDFLDRLNMIEEIAEADRLRLEELRQAADEVTEIKAGLEQRKSELESTKNELLQQQQELSEKREHSDQVLQELIAREAEFEDLLEESERKQDALMEELAQKEEEFDEAKYREWLETYVPPKPDPDVQTPAPEIPDSSTDWITPVPYYTLTSPFGMRLHPILGIYRMHNGVDLACAAMTPIYASRGGQVEVAAYQADGAGNYVQLNHGDGYRSIYMHMTYYTVSPGEYVAPGQVIGYVGNTGLSKGDHLHFGISYNGTYVNPMEYI